MHIGDWLGRRARLTPERVALRDMQRDGRPITYKEWDRAANRTANFLRQVLGVGPGDRVAVLAQNCVEYLDLWFALGKLGAVLVNLNWRLTPIELRRLVADAAPAALLYGGEFAATAAALREALAPAARCVLLGPGSPGSPGDPALSERDAQPDSPPPPVELSWDDPWVLCYTGGSSGLPKAAVLTYRSITANAANTVVSWGLTAADTAILDAPLYHTGGLNVFTAPLVYVGGTSLVCQRFQPEQVLDLIHRRQANLYFGVPTMFLALQEHPQWERADFTHMKLIISGGAPCPLPVFQRFFDRGVDFQTGYGLTEAGPNNFWLPPAQVRRKPGAVGYPLFHVDALVCRADGGECAPDEVGELLLRGPHLCAGYWQDRAATAAAIRPAGPDGQVWLHTGDLARRDADGCHYIVGRRKDLIISGGENVYPAEIESVLHGHRQVLEAAVIGVPHERWGEVCRAVVVLRQGATLTETELLEHLRGHLARYKVPHSVVFVDALPRTGAGKIDRRQVSALQGG